MEKLGIRKLAVIAAHAFVGWAGCGLSMAIGMSTTSMTNTLIIHAIVAFVLFFLVSLFYFRRFHYTSPLITATIIVSFVILADVFIVALLIEKSFEMFTSILGTWIPFALIFVSTYAAGRYVEKRG
jgi:hypothetical protein